MMLPRPPLGWHPKYGQPVSLVYKARFWCLKCWWYLCRFAYDVETLCMTDRSSRVPPRWRRRPNQVR